MTKSGKTPQPRVRQVFDYGGKQRAPLPLRIRPFVEIFDRGRGLPALVLAGQLEKGGLRVSIGAHQSVLLCGEVGSDRLGGYARVQPQEHALGQLHALRVEAEASDRDGESHAAISYYEVPRDRVAREEVSYASSWYSVYFNPLGQVDGTGLASPRSIAPRPGPS